MQAPRPFFTRVESLRGLGALAVAAWHFSGRPLHGVQLFPHAAWTDAGAAQNAIGRLGLCLLPAHAALMMFFVISGCVLRVSLQYGPQRAAPAAARFLTARLFRIYPIVMFGVCAAALVQGWNNPSGSGLVAAPLDVSTFLAQLSLLDVSWNGTLWALQVEVLMAPIILCLYFAERTHGPRALIALAALTTVLSFSRHWALWPPLSRNLFAFVVGMLIPTVGRNAIRGMTRTSANRWMAGAVLAMIASGPLLGMFSPFSGVIETYAAAVLVSLAAYRSDLSRCRWLDRKPVRLLGLSSGSMYVLHMPTLPAATAIAAAVIPLSWSTSAPAGVGFIVVGTWLLVIAPLMLASYHLVEAPGIALGRRINSGWNRASFGP